MAHPPTPQLSTLTSIPANNCSKSTVHIRQAESQEDLSTIGVLFKAYTDSLGIDLSFQSYAAELASLPGAYARPHGALLLATDELGTVLGCIAVRKLPYGNHDGKACEAKRLYVTPEGRGKGTGRLLIEAGIAAAKESGYEEMKLDTLANMDAAQTLYRRLGFQQTEAYYDNPVEGTVYMALSLPGKVNNSLPSRG